MTPDPVSLRAARDELLAEWRGVYDCVPSDREVTVDDLNVPQWWRSRGQLAHALRSMKKRGLLVGGRGRFRRIDLDWVDPLDPCMSCDGREGHHEPACYFATDEQSQGAPEAQSSPTGGAP